MATKFSPARSPFVARTRSQKNRKNAFGSVVVPDLDEIR